MTALLLIAVFMLGALFGMVLAALLIAGRDNDHPILLDLEDVTPSGLSDKAVIKAICRCLWHILEYLIRRA